MLTGTTKKARAYQLIRQAIIDGELQPGDILNLADLSKKYGLGITPVREALIVLESERYLHSLARTGFVINPVSVQDVLETFHLRMVLEVEAIGLAAERISPAELQALEENQQRELELAQQGQVVEHLLPYQLNREFHKLIARASGNRRLAQLVDQFLDDMERMLAMDPYIVDPQQHAVLLHALKHHDRQAAQEAMRNHLESTRARIYERF